MKQLFIMALIATLLSLIGCSESTDTQAPQQSAAPAAQTSSQTQPPGDTTMPQQQTAIDTAKELPKQGVVKKMMHASGYTYMSVDTGAGKPVWIAATIMRVKLEDTVQWAGAAVMHNFNSKSLHRTFDKILFVSDATVVK